MKEGELPKQYKARFQIQLSESCIDTLGMTLLTDFGILKNPIYDDEKKSYEVTILAFGPDDGCELSTEKISERIKGYPGVISVEAIPLE